MPTCVFFFDKTVCDESTELFYKISSEYGAARADFFRYHVLYHLIAVRWVRRPVDRTHQELVQAFAMRCDVLCHAILLHEVPNFRELVLCHAMLCNAMLRHAVVCFRRECPVVGGGGWEPLYAARWRTTVAFGRITKLL